MPFLRVIALVFISLFPLAAISSVFPLAVRLEGVGAFYGAGFKLGDVTGLAASGEVQGFGLLYKGKFQDFEITAFGGSIKRLSLTTTYLRGLQDDEASTYVQSLEGYALGAKAKYPLNRDLSAALSVSRSVVKLEEYREGAKEVLLPGANLFDIETLTARASLEIKLVNKKQEKGFTGEIGVSSLSGRTGQSDQLIMDSGAKLLSPIYGPFSFILVFMSSHAYVTSTRYDDKAAVEKALNIDCSKASDTTQQEACNKLEASLIDYLVASNKHGTATPVGGFASARSFRELRFKAANTAFHSAELRLSLGSLFFPNLVSNGKDASFGTFYDTAYASDDGADLWNKSVYSKGFGLNFFTGEMELQLQTSQGSFGSSAWSFSIGKLF